MSAFRTSLILAFLVTASVASAQPTTRRSSSQQQWATSRLNYSDRYGVLEQRNVFLRDRTRPSTQRSSSTAPSTQVARRPEQMLVVTGVVLEDEGYYAYVEDASGSPPRILRVAPGQNLGPGRVTDIHLDAIAYEQAGQRRWIDVGSDLTGQPAGAMALLSGGDGATTAPSDAAANLDPNDPNLTTEQRMRLRSLQQRQGR